MTEFEEKVTKFMQTFQKGSKNWQAYESAKNIGVAIFNPDADEYQVMIRVITKWLGL